jgi:hypothetical protein
MSAVEGLPGAKQLFAQILRDVESGTGQFADAVVTTQKIEPGLLRELGGNVDDARAALGLPRMFQGVLDEALNSRVAGAPPEETVSLIVDKLRTTTTPWQIAEEIPPLRQIIGDLRIPSAMEPIRNQTLEQLQRNADRIDGLIVDGFGRNPDYAELGGALANTELMLDVHRSGTTAAAEATRSVAGAVDEALTW